MLYTVYGILYTVCYCLLLIHTCSNSCLKTFELVGKPVLVPVLLEAGVETGVGTVVSADSGATAAATAAAESVGV
jgi:hypothetical protein